MDERSEQFLESSLESVDRAEEVVLEMARRAGFGEDELADIGMAVRESMVNAVVHGNRYSGHKKVRVRLSLDDKRLTIQIADEGEGFELESLPDPLAQDNLLRHSGRGIFLIRAFMDEFDVRRLSPHGTEATLVKYVGSK